MSIDLTEKEQDYLIRILEQNYADIYDDYGNDKFYGFENPVKHQIYLKLFGDHYRYDLRDKICFAEKNSELDKLSRQNSGYLGMGSGFYSILHLNDLHKRLNSAACVLTGQQQNGGQGTEFDEKFDRQCQEHLKDILKDLLIAFGVSPEELIEPKLEFDI